jgi:hypothetical protein
MAKTVALQNPSTRLAALLRDHGYRVTDLHAASLPHSHVDAILYNSNYPEATPLTASGDIADISLGGHTSLLAEDLPATIMLNVAGLNPQHALELLEQRLRHPGRHR